MSQDKELMQDLLYMQLLEPEEGYQVDFAVGCTFSLSMEGLVSVPLAFSKMGEANEQTDKTAMFLLQGILHCCDKFVLFCNKGSIHTPPNCQPLYSLMENSVVEVSNPNYPLANFHPKMWIIRQKPIDGEDGDQIIKLIIMSRNLTFSRDLDVAISVKGKIEENVINRKNTPIANMLRDLAEEYDKNSSRKAMIKGLADDVEKVEHFNFETPLSSKVFELHPTLFPSSRCKKYNNQNLYERLQGKRVLIISPFLDSNPVSGIAKNIIDKAEKKYLVTRDNNVTKEIIGMFDEVYVPNAALTENENCPVNLHAKMYLVEQKNGSVYLYLGSTNATHSAFHRNAELSIGIRVKDYTFDKMFETIVEPKNTHDPLYIKVSEPMVDRDEEQVRRDQESDLEHIMRWAMNSLNSAKITNTHNSPDYRVDLSFSADDKQKYHIDKCFGEYSVKIRPLQCPNAWKKINRKKMCMQWNLQLEELSEFYVVDVCNADESRTKSGVCKVATVGLQGHIDNRKKKIVNTIINSDNVLQYISMVLSDFPERTFGEWEHRMQSVGSNKSSVGKGMNVAIYEQLLKASFENEQKLDELKSVLENLKTDKYPEEMKSLFKAFGL